MSSESKCPVDHASLSPDKCPVDHASLSPDKCPVDHASLSPDKCPVDHSSARSSWAAFLPSFSSSVPPPSTSTPSLSQDRETSSIPRADTDANWVYPSEAQFFAAMARKQHDPHAADMRYIVPIHNAVNERAWAEVLRWENGQGGEGCGGVKLVSFQGRPSDLTPRARWKALIGYAKPFDRHDWVVDRCGTRIRYVIDFYTGKSQGPSTAPSFYLDVRPALDNWEGVRMRVQNFWGKWFGQQSSPSLPTKS